VYENIVGRAFVPTVGCAEWTLMVVDRLERVSGRIGFMKLLVMLILDYVAQFVVCNDCNNDIQCIK
jgi:hypothetical protein